jgi:hypothetical protein
MPLISKPWPSPRGPLQAEPAGERLLQVLGGDRRHGADVLVVAERVRRPPLAVDDRPGDVSDLGMDVQLHVAVAGGVLQPVRDDQVCLAPLAGLAPVDPLAVRARPGVASFPLEVLEADADGLPDHGVDFLDQGGPVTVPVRVALLAGQAGVLAERGVEDGDRLRQRQGEVEEERALAGLAGGPQAQLTLAVGSGARFGCQQLGVDVGSLLGACWRPSELHAIGGLSLAEEEVVGLAFYEPAWFEAEGLGGGTPPTAGRLSPGLGGLEVVASGILSGTAVDLLPDVVKVVALGESRDDRQRAPTGRRRRRRS